VDLVTEKVWAGEALATTKALFTKVGLPAAKDTVLLHGSSPRLLVLYHKRYVVY
jgi:hypothetical protein